MKVNRCKNCCISEKFPGIKVDKDGVCQLCSAYSKEKNQKASANNLSKIEDLISTVKKNNKSRYDVILSYSGGKDSSFTLYQLKERYDLRILAFLVDNHFVSDKAMENAKRFTNELQVDLVTYKIHQSLMKDLYVKSIDGDIYDSQQLTRANAACLSCIKVINSLTLEEAISRKIPIVAGGYIEGQIPKGAGVISTKYLSKFRQESLGHLADNLGQEWRRYFSNEDESFYPSIINPMLGIDYSEKEIVKTISQYGWEQPKDTGKSSSNCLLNDYAISRHFEKHGYHSYEAEICVQVRNGSLSKEEALEKLEDIKSSSSYNEIHIKLYGK